MCDASLSFSLLLTAFDMTSTLLPTLDCDVADTFLDPRCSPGMRDILPQVSYYLQSGWEASPYFTPNQSVVCWRLINTDVGLRCCLEADSREQHELRLCLWGKERGFLVEVHPSYHFLSVIDACGRHESSLYLPSMQYYETVSAASAGYNNEQLGRTFCAHPVVQKLNEDIRSLGASVQWTNPQWIQDLRKHLRQVLPHLRCDSLQDLFVSLIKEIFGSHPTFHRWRFVTQS